MRVLMIGAPGAGKGTQGVRVAAHYGIAHISSGDLLREHIATGSSIGRAARTYVESGDLVPDSVVLDMLRKPIVAASEQGGYVLDGFPRTAPQARALHDAAADDGASVEVAVHLEVPEDRLTERLLARGRDDDTPQVIAHRLEVYRRQTVPMLELYAERDLLVTVDGDGDVDEVSDRVERGLQERLRRRQVP